MSLTVRILEFEGVIGCFAVEVPGFIQRFSDYGSIPHGFELDSFRGKIGLDGYVYGNGFISFIERICMISSRELPF